MAGKDKYISEEQLQQLWKDYKENLKEQNKEWLNIQYVGRNGDRVTDPLKVPMTLEGFKRYCREHASEVHHYFINPDNAYDSYRTICRAIKEEIRENQIIGGMLGVYNPSITQRLNGLTEKTQTDATHSVNVLNIDPLDDGNS